MFFIDKIMREYLSVKYKKKVIYYKRVKHIKSRDTYTKTCLTFSSKEELKMKKVNDKRNLNTKISDTLLKVGLDMKIKAAKKDGQKMVNAAKKKAAEVKRNITKK